MFFFPVFYNMMFMQPKIQLELFFSPFASHLFNSGVAGFVSGAGKLESAARTLWHCSALGPPCGGCRRRSEMIKIWGWFFAAPCWNNTRGELRLCSLTVIKTREDISSDVFWPSRWIGHVSDHMQTNLAGAVRSLAKIYENQEKTKWKMLSRFAVGLCNGARSQSRCQE